MKLEDPMVSKTRACPSSSVLNCGFRQSNIDVNVNG